jgi:hypothetical protein
LDSDGWVRRAAARKIGDPAALSELARSGDHADTALKALQQIEDQAVLADIARAGNCPEVRAAAVARVADPAVRAQAALEDTEPEVRLAAVKTITDQEILRKVASLEDNQEVLMAAVEKVDYEANGPDGKPIWGNWRDRLAEVQTTSDPNVLGMGAMMDAHPLVRAAAAARIDDEHVLDHLALKDPHPLVRAAAVRRLDFQPMLWQVASSDPSPTVRAAAVDAFDWATAPLADSPTWGTIRGPEEHTADYESKLDALDKIEEHPDGVQAAFREAAINNSDSLARLLATVGIENQADLREVVVRASDPEVRLVAVERLLLKAHLPGGVL